MTPLQQYVNACVERIRDMDNFDAVYEELGQVTAAMAQLTVQYTISGHPLALPDFAYCAWTVGVRCANAYAAAGPGFDRRFRAERNRQRKIAVKLGLDFSEYDNTDTLPAGNCTRRQLLDAVPLAMDKAKGDGE